MKTKLILSLLCISCSLGVWGDTSYFVTTKTEVSSIESGKYYVIDGRDQLGSSLHFLFDDGTKVTSNNPQDLPANGESLLGRFIWRIVDTSEGYTLQNMYSGKYMSLGSSNGSQISTSSTPQTNYIYFSGGYATICNSNGQAIDIGYYGDNPTTWSGGSTPEGSRRLKIYIADVVEIADDACYTIDFVNKAGTKTWGLKAGTTEVKANPSGVGDVFVAHSYTNLSGLKRWIFVNNSDGTYLTYHGEATSTFNITNAVNEWNISSLSIGDKVAADAPIAGKLCITNDYRGYGSYPASTGTYILSESTGNYDNSSVPYYDGLFTSALQFTATGDAVSPEAALSIAKFKALNEVRGYLSYSGNISALFENPSGIEADINAAADAGSASMVATNFMKSPEGKKFYAVNSGATGQYLNIGESFVTATSTKLYAEAVMQVEYAGDGRYYLKSVKNGTYACTPGGSSISTTSSIGTAESFYIGNIDNDTDNKVYFSNKRTSGNYGAIHYSSGYTYKCVGWTYNAGNSQWNITYISDSDYETLCNVNDVTYNVIVAPSGAVKASCAQTEVKGTPLTIPASIAKDFCNYTFYSDVACTSALTIVPDAATSTVYALAIADAPFTVSSNFASATWHNLVLKNGFFPLYNSGSTPNVSLPNSSQQTEINMEWAFIGNPYDGYQIINKGAGDGYELSSDTDNGGNSGESSYATMTPNGTETYNRWFPKSSTYYANGFYLYNSANHALNQRSTANLAYWTGGADAGSTFTVSSVTANAEELAGIVAELKGYTYGTSYGQYNLSSPYSGWVESMEGEIIPALDPAKVSYSYDNLLIARGCAGATYLNMPSAPCFLRIQSTQGANAYLKAVDSGTLKFSTTKDKETIFLWDGDGKLISYTRGLRCKDVKSVATYDETPAYCIYNMEEAVSGEIGKYSVTSNYNNGKVMKHYLYSTGTDGSDADRNTESSGFYANNTFNLEAVKSLPISISSAGYATLYAPVALEIPAEVTAYVATDMGDYISLTAIEGGIIPANTGVILSGAAGSYDFNITTGGSIDSNALTGTVATIARPENSYILATGTSGLALYKDGATKIPGFKAYLEVPSGGEVKAFRFDDDETGIGNLLPGIFENEDTTIYNIAGQRVSKLQKGINIVNGKKVLY